MSNITIVFADEHEGFRTAVCSHLRRTKQVTILAEAENGVEALEYVQKFSPSILLLDMRLPQLDGVEVVKAIHSENLPVKVLAFSVFDNDEYIRAIYDYGAAGYLLKNEKPDTLLTVISRVFHGERPFFSHAVAEKLRSWGYEFDNKLATE